jgi:hypothetical protein
MKDIFLTVRVAGKIVASNIALIELDEARNLYGMTAFFQKDFFLNIWQEQASKYNFAMTVRENLDGSLFIDAIDFRSEEDYLLCLMANHGADLDW